MHHSPDQLDALWNARTGADGRQRAEVLQPYANPRMPGVLPHVARNDAHGQVLAIPTPDHPGRHAYERRPGGAWQEQH